MDNAGRIDNLAGDTLRLRRTMPSKVEVVEGDLLDQDVEVIVNSWNRNIIPWWMNWASSARR
jgi:hypothetical protein